MREPTRPQDGSVTHEQKLEVVREYPYAGFDRVALMGERPPRRLRLFVSSVFPVFLATVWAMMR